VYKCNGSYPVIEKQYTHICVLRYKVYKKCINPPQTSFLSAKLYIEYCKCIQKKP